MNHKSARHRTATVRLSPAGRVSCASINGFALIEVAIVIIIISLILGGVLKGQELMRTARTHNVADQGSAVKVAITSFADRFRALPGDYNAASTHIPGVDAGQDGDGNGRVGYDDGAVPGTPDATNRRQEAGLVWLHLVKAGFISGAFDGSPLGEHDEARWACPATTCVTNAFKGSLLFLYADEQTGVSQASDNLQTNQLWSGKNLPVEVVAELDRKQDDGQPSSGQLRVGDGFLEGTPAPVGHICATGGARATTDETGGIKQGTPFVWDVKSQVTNCGVVMLF